MYGIKDIYLDISSPIVVFQVEVASHIVAEVFTSDRCEVALEPFYDWVTRLTHILFFALFTQNAVDQIAASACDISLA